MSGLKVSGVKLNSMEKRKICFHEEECTYTLM